MYEKQLTESQRNRIIAIKEEWLEEICKMEAHWQQEKEEMQKRGEKAAVILDGPKTKAYVELEHKYKSMIRKVQNKVDMNS